MCVRRCLNPDDSHLRLLISWGQIKDVAQFVVIYAILVLAFSLLFVGVGDIASLHPVCDADNDEGRMFMSCRPSYFILRTLFQVCFAPWVASHRPHLSQPCPRLTSSLFQSFGEFFLEEMNNDASVAFLVITFLILNVILMNLLIAM